MGKTKQNGTFSWLRNLFFQKKNPPNEITQARALLAAIDRGGIPLNPAKLNAIARNLGLDVSRTARPEETIQRIRAALARST